MTRYERGNRNPSKNRLRIWISATELEREMMEEK